MHHSEDVIKLHDILLISFVKIYSN